MKTHNDPSREGRVIAAVLTPEAFLAILRGRARWAIREFPEDAEILSVNWEPMRRSWIVTIASKEYTPVREGDELRPTVEFYLEEVGL